MIRPKDVVKQFEDKFWSKVRKGKRPNDCWEWTDYSNLYVSKCGFWGGVRAQVASWIINKGTVGKGQEVGVTCGNPMCVNPSHLELKRRRGPKGNTFRFRSSAKEWVPQYALGETTIKSIAEKYGVSQATVMKYTGMLAGRCQ